MFFVFLVFPKLLVHLNGYKKTSEVNELITEFLKEFSSAGLTDVWHISVLGEFSI